jgi:hypothetical protein
VRRIACLAGRKLYAVTLTERHRSAARMSAPPWSSPPTVACRMGRGPRARADSVQFHA